MRSTMAYLWRKHFHELSQYPWRLVSIADPSAPPSMKSDIIQDFGSHNPCCLPKGVARSLREEGADLQGGETTSFLFWFAHMARLTTADVEVRHARNSTSAGKTGNTAFSGIAAQYVVVEYAELRRASVMAATTLRSAADAQHPSQLSLVPPPRATEAAGDDDALALHGRRCRRGRSGSNAASRPKRGKTALQCFAADHTLADLKEPWVP